MKRLLVVSREVGKFLIIAIGISATLAIVGLSAVDVHRAIQSLGPDDKQVVRQIEWIIGTKADGWVRLHPLEN